IVFWGSALDDGLIEPEGASVITWRAARGPLERGQSGGVSFVHAMLPDYELAAGIERSGDVFTSLTAHGTSLHCFFAAEETAKVKAAIRGVAAKPGDGQLHIGFAPLENPTDGQTSWSYEVHVLPKGAPAEA